MPSYAIVSRPDAVSERLKERLNRILSDQGFTIAEDCPETVLVIGGDGTFIYAVHKYIDVLDRVRFFGIHTGTLGFYTDYRDTDFEAFAADFVHGRVTEFSYPILEGKTEHETFYGINEIRVENAVRTQEMNVYLNNSLFEVYRGTGMCVSTQLGSTAYNRSVGGAVIQDGLDLIQMTEIAGIHHSKYRSLNSPFVMAGDTEIAFTAKSFAGAMLGADSEVFPLDNARRIMISVSDSKRVRMLKGRNVYYFDRLQSLF
ncbi:MAG: NAD(+)/NADH kinase [Solobacterium sp.]|nr:NAD(+)/NADH kinase [Solobacterium sp.]